MRRLPVVLATALLVLALAPVASAQWDPAATAQLGAGYGQNALAQSTMRNAFGTSGSGSGSSSRPKPKPKPRKATRAQLRTLGFTPATATTSAHAQAIKDTLVASCPPDRYGCPLDHVAIAAQGVDSGDHRVRFRANIRTLVGGTDRNVADGIATFMVVAWLAQRPTLKLTEAQAQGAKRLKADLRNQLALDPEVRRMPDASKQRLVELLGAIAQHSLSLRHAYGQLGQAEEGERLTRHLREVADELTSVDVRDLRLTRKGFVRK